MTARIIFRHLVDSEAAWKDYIEAEKAIRDPEGYAQKQGITFGCILMVDLKKLGSDLQGEIRNHFVNGQAGTKPVYERQGSGTAFKKIICTREGLQRIPQIVVCADLDQYAPRTPEDIAGIARFVEQMEGQQALYGIGARTVPVKLALYERNNNLRIICEMLFAQMFAEKPLMQKQLPDGANVTKAYHNNGDWLSGFYAINQAHGEFPRIASTIEKAKTRDGKPLKGFAIEAYTALLAKDHSSYIFTDWVPSKKNMIYNIMAEHEERKHVEDIIKRETGDFVNVNGNGALKPEGRLVMVLRSEECKKRIAESGFNEEDINTVCTLMWSVFNLKISSHF
jgi:hypothetical protein